MSIVKEQLIKVFKSRIFYVFLVFAVLFGVYAGRAASKAENLDRKLDVRYRENMRNKIENGEWSPRQLEVYGKQLDSEYRFYGVFDNSIDSNNSRIILFAVPVLILLFTALYVSRAYKDGTIRNKLIAGHSKGKILLGQFAVVFAASFCIFILSALAFILSSGKALNAVNTKTILFFLITFFLTCCSAAAICIVIVNIEESTAVSIVFTILVIAVLFAYAAMTMENLSSNTSRVPEYVDEYSDYLSDKERSGKTAREIFLEEAVSFASPAGLFIAELQLTENVRYLLEKDIWREIPREKVCYEVELAHASKFFFVYSMIQLVAFYLLGVIILKKKNFR